MRVLHTFGILYAFVVRGRASSSDSTDNDASRDQSWRVSSNDAETVKSESSTEGNYASTSTGPSHENSRDKQEDATNPWSTFMAATLHCG